LEETSQQRKPTWPIVLAATSLALTTALAVINAFGWVDSPALNALVVATAMVTLITALLNRELVGASRKQRRLAFLVVTVVVSISVLSAFVLDPREHQPLGPPSQRTIAGINSDCSTPDLPRLLPGPLRIVASRAARMGAEKSDVVVLLSTNPAEKDLVSDEATLSIFVCQGTTEWKRPISRTVNIAGCEASLRTTQLRSPKQEEVLFAVVCGSGQFLDFWLFGWDNKTRSIRELMAREGLFQGSVDQIADKLVVEAGGTRNDFRWIDGSFSQTTANFAPAAEGVIISFWWDDTGGHADLPVLKVQPEERVYFRWAMERNKDQSVRSFRVVAGQRDEDSEFSVKEQGAEFGIDEHGQPYLVLKRHRVRVVVTVFPNGYGSPAISVAVLS
jgi:uncharacterized protein YndB with AHSA1/START domain